MRIIMEILGLKSCVLVLLAFGYDTLQSAYQI